MLEHYRIAPSKEQLFTERYAQLLAWALRLTNNHRASAEDLVQDAFIQFTLSNTSLDRIANVDGYLRRMLQYMHFSRISRRLSLSSISDYDSLQSALRVPGISDQIQARDELDQICRYACLRKESSRAGSVLILRFFHDYSPREIAQIIGSTRHSVDEWQRVARRELKLFLREPNKLTFTGPVDDPPSIESLTQDDDITSAMRRVIFQSRRGNCPSLGDLQTTYQTGRCVGTQQLSHIVSCYHCLDSINAMLGLGLLKDRNVPPPSQSGSGANLAEDDVDTGPSAEHSLGYQRKLEEIVDHRPGQLSVAIDGEIVGTLRVTSNENELELNRLLDDEFDFIEVFGERGVRLLFVTPSEACHEAENIELELSDERRLAISIKPDTHHTRIVLEYEDPTYRAPVPTIIENPLRVICSPRSEDRSKLLLTGLRRLKKFVHDFTAALLAGIRGAEASAGRAAQERGTGCQVGATAVSNETSSELSSRLVALRNFPRLFLRPLAITLIVSLALSVSILYLKTTIRVQPKAEDLLSRAIAAEVQHRTVVAHSVLSLEERRSPEGAVIARHRIEVWEDIGAGNQTQRLLDENENTRLKAGRWKTKNSLSTYDRNDGLRSNDVEPAQDQWKTSRIWHHLPSARGFLKLAREGVVQVREKPGSYVLSLDNPTEQSNGLIHATLTLRSDDLHAIEQTLFVRLPTETREYRFAEISFEERKSAEVDPAVFSPDKELLRSETPPVEVPLHHGVPRRVEKAVFATPAFEVEVVYLLNLVGANQGEQVNLVRLSNGTLKVEGIVESDRRREQILHVLAPLRSNPLLTVDLATADNQLATRNFRTSTQSFLESDSMPDKLLVEDDLRRFVSQTVTESQVNDEVRRLASRAVNRAYRSLFHTIELNSLINRFTESDLAGMDVESRRKWLDMLHEHAEAVEREAQAFHKDIGPILSPVTQAGAIDKSDPIESHRDLVASVRRLYLLAISHQEFVCSAFTISNKRPSMDIRAKQFWMSLALIEDVASKIRQYPMKE